MKGVDTCGLSFSDLRESEKYYVDKTLLIKDILDTNDRGIYLFTRPRRFGKTTNITMLEAFFNIEYAGNTWFDGLAISGYHEYDGYRNRFPVIQLNLKDLVSGSGVEDYPFFLSMFGKALRDAFRPLAYLLDSDRLLRSDKILIESILECTADGPTMATAVKELCGFITDVDGVRPILLIDEYDRAMVDISDPTLQEKIVRFMGIFLSSTLKNNRNLQMAYMTGVMQITKAGLFSGINNITVNTTFSRESEERFGFTGPEVRDILEYYGHPDRMDEVRGWYDGYRFGDSEVYNPFSVMSYVSGGFVPDSYWANSGRNLPLRWMLDRADSIGFGTVYDLIEGGSVEASVRRSMAPGDLRSDSVADLLSLMVMTGYLNAVPTDEDDLYTLSIPNREVLGIVEDMLIPDRRVDDDLLTRFDTAVLEGDADMMVDALRAVLTDGSYFDPADEKSYGMVVLMMLHGILRGYKVTAQRDPGNGSVGLILEPKGDGTVPIIIELPASNSEDVLDGEVDSAIRQIHEEEYYQGMRGDVILMRMSFSENVVCGKVERYSPPE